MKFDLYQIRLSAADVDAVNSGAVCEKHDFKVRMMMDFRGTKIGGFASEAFNANLYTKVATITAEDYDDAFEVGNIGPENQIERYGRMSSVSVGDVLVAEDGTVAVVANIGFVAFGHRPELAA
jgi:hypothetical protein